MTFSTEATLAALMSQTNHFIVPVVERETDFHYEHQNDYP